MVEDVERIGRFIADLDRESFRRSEQVVFAVCYAFVRLGEAVVHVPESVTAAHPEIEWSDIRHSRSFMVHVYPSVDPGRLYDTAKADLPPPLVKLRSLLDT